MNWEDEAKMSQEELAVEQLKRMRKRLQKKADAYHMLEETVLLSEQEERALRKTEAAIEWMNEFEKFYAEVGLYVEIPCGKHFSFIIEPQPLVDRISEDGIVGHFVLEDSVRERFIDCVFDDSEELYNWFDQLTSTMLVGLYDAPFLNRLHTADLNEIIAYFQSEKICMFSSEVDHYIEFLLEQND